jgi:glutamate racemase
VKKVQNKPSDPIGIFDSGIGGLTVASAISQALPSEKLIYFGDTAHLPYGDKSPDSIKYYSIRIADFLLEQKAKCIVIACNTASSFAYEAVKKHVQGKVPVISVIEPTVEKITNMFDKGKIGVIGTKGTVKSDVYKKKIEQVNDALEVVSLATPLLAPMIEEGFFNNKISKTVIDSYLSRPKLKKIDALILACTHYPLIRKEIDSFYSKNTVIVDSAQAVADKVKAVLLEAKLTSKAKKPSHSFFVSDFTQSFQESTKIFFKGPITLKHYPIWDNE